MHRITRRAAILSTGAAAIMSAGVVAGCSRATRPPIHLSADRRFYNSATELFDAADVVVRVNVGTGSSTGYAKKLNNGRLSDDKSLPTRIVTVAVIEVFKGRPDTSIRVAQIHGRRADGGEVIDDDDQVLDLDAEYVLFLNTFADTPAFADAPAVIKGGSQGQFRVTEGKLRAVSTETTWSLTLRQLRSMR